MIATTRRLAALFLLATSVLSTACGGGSQDGVKAPAQAESLDDAFALLPSGAIAIGTVDARAFFSSQTFGASLAKLVEKYVPIGPEAGFQASRDVDRVTFGSYSYSGIDVAAVVIGRFDEAKIKQVAAQKTPTKSGGVLVASQYAGRDVYTINNVGFTVLSSTRAVVGTEGGIRRVLERIQDHRVKRDITKWMIDTVETPGSAAAVAADFATTPIPPDVLRKMSIPSLQSLTAVRALANFKAPGTQLAGSLTYSDASAASAAADQANKLAKMTMLLAVLGIKIQNIDIKTEKQDLQLKLDIDDQSLRTVLDSAPQWLGQ